MNNMALGQVPLLIAQKYDTLSEIGKGIKIKEN
jgi:hypothetical protein